LDRGCYQNWYAPRMSRGAGWLLLGLWAAPALGGAGGGAFPPITNHSALARVAALPALGEPAVLAPGSRESRLTLDVANEFELTGFTAAGDCAADECLWLDSESYRLAFRYRGGLAGGWDWSLELPWIVQDEGFLDGAIEQWHEWLSLPNGGREYREHDQYRYFYRKSGDTLLDVSETSSGPGDVLLGLGRRLGPRTALRVQAKLPTGDDAHLAGGNAGAALWLDQGLTLGAAVRGYVAAGASVADEGEVLAQQQNRVIAIGGAGLSWQAFDALALHAQLLLHGRLYDHAQTRALRRNGAVLGVGLRYRASRSVAWDLSLLEDTNVNVSPDFGVQLNAVWTP